MQEFGSFTNPVTARQSPSGGSSMAMILVSINNMKILKGWTSSPMAQYRLPL
jgi:hypothetical protein